MILLSQGSEDNGMSILRTIARCMENGLILAGSARFMPVALPFHGPRASK
jgi:hypothetical protein